MAEKPNSYYAELHKNYLEKIVNFQYSFEKGENDQLKNHLDKLKSAQNGSISGEMAMRTYEEAKRLGLYNCQPIITRVYVGQLLLKVRPDGSGGFVNFIKFITSEIQHLNPLLQNQINEIVSLVERYGKGRASTSSALEELKLSLDTKQKGREKDPLFGDDDIPESDLDEKFGALENIDSMAEKLGNLDPFQTVLYKILIEKAYKGFKEEIINKTSGAKKAFSRNQGVKAINDFQKWIVDTTREMSFKRGPALPGDFDRRISMINFPSLRITVAKIEVADYRETAKKQVSEGLKQMRPLIQSLSGFPAPIYEIIGRTKSSANGENRVFLNRFHQISVLKFKNETGDQKYLYEFMALAFDRIEDDNEFARLSKDMKPIMAKLLKGSPIIDSLSQKVFNKSISQLTQDQIVSLLDYVLPSTTLTKSQEQSDLSKKINELLKEVAGNLGSLRRADPEKFRLIANILHIAKNEIVSIGTENDPEKAKKKLSEFVERFNLARNLLGDEVMETIKKTNKYLYSLLANPEQTISIACFFNKNINYVKQNFESINKTKRPDVVTAMLSDARLTSDYLKARFERAVEVKNVSIIQNYGNQMRAVDLAVMILEDCWTEEQFKEKEEVVLGILNDTPYLVVSQNAQKYIDLVAASKVENEKQNYGNMLGVTYDVKKHILNLFGNQLLKGQYSFAQERLTGLISRVVASYGNEIEIQNKSAGINVYAYLTDNGETFVSNLIGRINEILKSVNFRDENGRMHRLHGLNKVQTAVLNRNVKGFIKNQIMPKVKEAAQA